MRFLIDEDLPRSTDDLLRRYGHEAIDVRDIGLSKSKRRVGGVKRNPPSQIRMQEE